MKLPDAIIAGIQYFWKYL